MAQTDYHAQLKRYNGKGKDYYNIYPKTNAADVYVNTSDNSSIPSTVATLQDLTDLIGALAFKNNESMNDATADTSGAMSAADKAKLDSIDTNANYYVHPMSGVNAGTYNVVTVDTQGHVTSAKFATTIDEIGLENAAYKNHTHSSGDITDLDASKLTGTLPLSVIPAAAQERLIIVADTEARLALTSDDVQPGDVVQEEDTGHMYYCVDNTNLADEDSWRLFIAGTASKLGTVDVGSGINPMYLVEGVATASTSTVGSGIRPIYLYKGNLTVSSSTVGSPINPVWLSGGTITSSTITVGSAIQPLYMSAGNLVASSATIGSEIVPMYLSEGLLTASTTTVGSSIVPIYMNEGLLTASSSTVGSSIKPIYLNNGTLTASTSTVGSDIDPVFLSGGTITKSTGTVGGVQKAIYLKDGTLTEIDSTTVYISDNPSTAEVGGVEKGYVTDENGIEIVDLVYNILHPYVAPSLTAVIKPTASGTYEIGTTRSITGFTVTITLGSTSIQSITMTTTSSTTALVTVTSGIVAGANTVTYAADITTTTTFKATIVDGAGKSYSANTGTYTFVYAIYYGAIGESEDPTATNVAALTKVIQSKGSKSLYYTTNNQRMVFAYPASYGNIAKVLDANSFDVTTTFTKYSITINSVSYYAYANNAATVDTFKMTFSW